MYRRKTEDLIVGRNHDLFFLQGGSGKPLWVGSQLDEQSWVKKQLKRQSFQFKGQSIGLPGPYLAPTGQSFGLTEQSFGLTEQSWLSLKLSQCSHSPGGVQI